MWSSSLTRFWENSTMWPSTINFRGSVDQGNFPNNHLIHKLRVVIAYYIKNKCDFFIFPHNKVESNTIDDGSPLAWLCYVESCCICGCYRDTWYKPANVKCFPVIIILWYQTGIHGLLVLHNRIKNLILGPINLSPHLRQWLLFNPLCPGHQAISVSAGVDAPNVTLQR